MPFQLTHPLPDALWHHLQRCSTPCEYAALPFGVHATMTVVWYTLPYTRQYGFLRMGKLDWYAGKVG